MIPSPLSTGGLTSGVEVHSTGSFRELVNNLSVEQKQIKVAGSTEEAMSLSDYLSSLTNEELDQLFNWITEETEHEVSNADELLEALAQLDLTLIDLDENEDNLLINQLIAFIQLQQVNTQEEDIRAGEEWQALSNQSLYSGHLTIREVANFDVQSYTQSLNEMVAKLNQLTSMETKQLLDLLKQWTQASETEPEAISQWLKSSAEHPNFKIFSQVLSNFQNKWSLNLKAAYQMDSTVTTADLVKWLSHAETGDHSTFGQLFSQTQGHTTIEQLIVHLGDSDTTLSAENFASQLIDKLQVTLSKSSFLNGSNQLLLKLAPESLGDILVELTEIDGEMLVKLTASTQAAKEALEANAKELRHMFSPHNIVIEKDDLSQAIIETHRGYNQSEDQGQQEQQDHHWLEQEHDQDQESSVSFEEFLMNERV